MDAKVVDAARQAFPAGPNPLTLGAVVHQETLQALAEQLSAAGVPVFVADLKGDLSGLAVPGQSDPRIAQRANQDDRGSRHHAGDARLDGRAARPSAPEKSSLLNA